MLVQKSSFQFARKAMISFSRSQPNDSQLRDGRVQQDIFDYKPTSQAGQFQKMRC